jgi:hypothetical protein
VALVSYPWVDGGLLCPVQLGLRVVNVGLEALDVELAALECGTRAAAGAHSASPTFTASSPTFVELGRAPRGDYRNSTAKCKDMSTAGKLTFTVGKHGQFAVGVREFAVYRHEFAVGVHRRRVAVIADPRIRPKSHKSGVS